MSKTRQYLATCDDGRDYFTFTFESSHRANSKANHSDARLHYSRIHGFRRYTIISTELYPYY